MRSSLQVASAWDPLSYLKATSRDGYGKRLENFDLRLRPVPEAPRLDGGLSFPDQPSGRSVRFC